MDVIKFSFAFLALLVLLAECVPPPAPGREKRGIAGDTAKGAVIGTIAGAILPGVSAKQGLVAGGALGAAGSFLKGKLKDKKAKEKREAALDPKTRPYWG